MTGDDQPRIAPAFHQFDKFFVTRGLGLLLGSFFAWCGRPVQQDIRQSLFLAGIDQFRKLGCVYIFGSGLFFTFFTFFAFFSGAGGGG